MYNKMSKDGIYFSESLYGAWLSNSLLLMTMSLLFYHMTKVKSLEMDRRLAGVFAVALIIISIIMGVSSIFPYFTRIGNIVKKDKDKDKEEDHYRTMYVVLGSILILIQLGIAVTIVLGAFKSNE